MPTAAAKNNYPVLSWVGFILAGFALLAGLVAAAPDFDLMGQLAGQRFGLEGRRAVNEWRQLLAGSAELSENEQLRAVNDFINRKVRFSNDADIWGKPDYWATPLETLGRGMGDCEDFSIAKYISLKLLGVPGEKLRMTYVKASLGGTYSQITQAHMVLGYYPTPTGEPLILDNLSPDILPASRRRDLHPVFSFSMENLWVGTSAMPAANASARLSHWRDVLNRMRGEGLNVLFEPEKKLASRPKVEKTKEEPPPVRAQAVEKQVVPRSAKEPAPPQKAEKKEEPSPASAQASEKQVAPQSAKEPVPPQRAEKKEEPLPASAQAAEKQVVPPSAKEPAPPQKEEKKEEPSPASAQAPEKQVAPQPVQAPVPPSGGGGQDGGSK
ncbi:MAG: transglutaminase-like cysteine peptidase [Desulfurivibrionaceae bacterium]